eukprot:CAMPEP_0115110978 /NCGR_PEP_ID=MMETSP0227-20121206/39741_1 /TAXON_ID=89957 /ORGANISM="Polarella glacialis, Strain CCMP 1383" /LENGTH=74 /DNA_ID=CAMNT_0002510207 /DNA_START=62 /DNA_END=283 /DNA_ORIENTATION=-
MGLLALGGTSDALEPLLAPQLPGQQASSAHGPLQPLSPVRSLLFTSALACSLHAYWAAPLSSSCAEADRPWPPG